MIVKMNSFDKEADNVDDPGHRKCKQQSKSSEADCELQPAAPARIDRPHVVRLIPDSRKNYQYKSVECDTSSEGSELEANSQWMENTDQQVNLGLARNPEFVFVSPMANKVSPVVRRGESDGCWHERTELGERGEESREEQIQSDSITRNTSENPSYAQLKQLKLQLDAVNKDNMQKRKRIKVLLQTIRRMKRRIAKVEDSLHETKSISTLQPTQRDQLETRRGHKEGQPSHSRRKKPR